MGMKLADLRSKTASVKVEFGDDTLTINYRPNAITPNANGENNFIGIVVAETSARLAAANTPDRFNVGDHLFASVTAPLFGYVNFSAFVGRELHAVPTSANLNRFDVGVTYDALAHWQAARRR